MLREVINTRLKTHSHFLLRVELDDALSFYTSSHWKNSHTTSHSQLDNILHLNPKTKTTGRLTLEQPQMLKHSINAVKDEYKDTTAPVYVTRWYCIYYT